MLKKRNVMTNKLVDIDKMRNKWFVYLNFVFEFEEASGMELKSDSVHGIQYSFSLVKWTW